MCLIRQEQASIARRSWRSHERDLAIFLWCVRPAEPGRNKESRTTRPTQRRLRFFLLPAPPLGDLALADLALADLALADLALGDLTLQFLSRLGLSRLGLSRLGLSRLGP